MKLKNIALDNLKRRKSKMLFLVIGMTIGIATIVALFTVTQTMQENIKNKLDKFGANIMIVPKANTLSMSYGGISIPGAQFDVHEITEKEVDEIWTIKNKGNLAVVSPKLIGSVNTKNNDVLVVGVDLATEIELKIWWEFSNESIVKITRTENISTIDSTKTTVTSEIKGLKENDVIIGSTVSITLNKKAGDKILLNNQEFQVAAVLKTMGSQDDSIIFMNLKKAQDLLDKKEKITLVEVAALCSGCPVEEMARQINEAIPSGNATPIKQVVQQKMETINKLNNFGFIIGAIVLIIGSLIVFTTMMSSVNERTREIGIFRAIGFRRIHIIKIILIEAIISSFISGIIGYMIGITVASIASLKIAGIESHVFIDEYLLVAVALSVFMGTIATIYPALKASKIDPSEALRYI